MSTSYYRLKPPVTHLRLEEGDGHDRLTIWVNHANAGTLTLRKEEMREMLDCFILHEADNECPLRSYWGGADRGAVVYANENDLPDEMMVISEYGELLTVAQVKARDGAHRKDGWPTELFGYEGRV